VEVLAGMLKYITTSTISKELVKLPKQLFAFDVVFPGPKTAPASAPI
jgi:hypothetical protein